MNWLTIVTTIFDIAWLLALLYVLWRFMRSSERSAKSNQQIAASLVGISESNAQAALKAAQAAQDSTQILSQFLKEHIHADQ